MWVRIQELSFAPEVADALVRQLRDTMVSRYQGGGHRGSRLLLNRTNGKALDVSYWNDAAGAHSDLAPGSSGAIQALGATLGATDSYELAIDAC
jgi:hypothetical protein